MTGSGAQRTAAFYRRPLGVAWLVAAVLIPLLVAAIGFGLHDRSRSQTVEPNVAWPTLTESAAPESDQQVPPVTFAPLSVVWTGADITLAGELPDGPAQQTLLDTVIEAVGPDVNVNDNVAINPNIAGLDFAGAGPVFTAARAIENFSFAVEGQTITVTGTAADAAAADAVQAAIVAAWPDLNLVNEIETR